MYCRIFLTPPVDLNKFSRICEATCDDDRVGGRGVSCEAAVDGARAQSRVRTILGGSHVLGILFEDDAYHGVGTYLYR